MQPAAIASKVTPLADAVRAHVVPGLHLNFASTPSRSNAAVREVARIFRGADPRFVLSSTGFHSLAHVLARLGLGRKYVACFFGDNYPVPRPNALYEELPGGGIEIEIWSLWSYVSALRAGALGHATAVTNSLVGTTMGEELAAAKMFTVLEGPPRVGLIHAMRSDLTFVHALLGDADGNLVFSPPFSEGFWGAIGARRGVIATVERVVERGSLAGFGDAMRIPAHRVLAVCEEPFGAHPQPLYAAPRFGPTGYVDDFEHYERWRELATSQSAFAAFSASVLDAEDGGAAYRRYVGEARLNELVDRARAVGSVHSKHPVSSRPPPRASLTVADDASGRLAPLAEDPRHGRRTDNAARANEILLVLGARAIAERVREKGYPIVLAGIGHAFLAARLAKLWLAAEGVDVKIMVETGLFDLECGPAADEFLLSYRNTALAGRHSSVEDILGAMTCGADSVCLGVLGAAQIDSTGSLNSTRVQGKLLVGSGGANDIASAAAEVVVLTRCVRSRIVERVEYITSPGHRVSTVATDLCTLTRSSEKAPWLLHRLYPAHGGRPPDHAVGVIRDACAWPLQIADDVQYAPLISTSEMADVHRLDPYGVHWRRER